MYGESWIRCLRSRIAQNLFAQQVKYKYIEQSGHSLETVLCKNRFELDIYRLSGTHEKQFGLVFLKSRAHSVARRGKYGSSRPCRDVCTISGHQIWKSESCDGAVCVPLTTSCENAEVFQDIYERRLQILSAALTLTTIVEHLQGYSTRWHYWYPFWTSVKSSFSIRSSEQSLPTGMSSSSSKSWLYLTLSYLNTRLMP